MKVAVLGADGFIGRHIAFHLRAEGVAVLAQARNPARLAAMGFDTLRADLTDPATHTPAFWAERLQGCSHIVNGAGLLTGSEAAFNAVHVAAPAAAYAAIAPGHILLISAVGIEADTRFAAARRQGEAVAEAAGATILRPGLVMADTSYGGSSLIRALAAFPMVTPLVAGGTQAFNPIHAADLAAVVLDCLRAPLPAGRWEVGGPDVVDQAALIDATQGWLGLPPRPAMHVPLAIARALGRIGDVLRLGPVSATAVAQLQAGVLADAAPLLAQIATRPRGFRAFLSERPAGTQDLWHARLYLLKPAIRLVLAAMWLASAALGLFTPADRFLPQVATFPAPLTLVLARGGGVIDALLGLALLRNWRPVAVGWAQFLLAGAYTLGLGFLAPQLWLDPFGGLLKNLPVLMLILVHLALAEER